MRTKLFIAIVSFAVLGLGHGTAGFLDGNSGGKVAGKPFKPGTIFFFARSKTAADRWGLFMDSASGATKLYEWTTSLAPWLQSDGLGNTYAFVAEEKSGDYFAWALSRESKPRKLGLVPGANGPGITITPDGKALCVIGGDKGPNLQLSELRTGHSHRFSVSSRALVDPMFSARGNAFVIVSKKGSGWGLTRITSTGTKTISLKGTPQEPVLEPNGRLVAFSLRNADQQTELWLWDVEKQHLRKISREGGGWHPSFSAEGTAIYFVAPWNPTYYEKQGLFVINVDGSNPRRVAGPYYIISAISVVPSRSRLSNGAKRVNAARIARCL